VLQLKPIAVIHTDFPSKFGIPRQGGLVDALKAEITFEPEYRDPSALRGLEGFSHLWLIWLFSESVLSGWSPTVKPPRLGGNRRMGVFATRSPFRPNPLGLSCVRLEGIELCGYEIVPEAVENAKENAELNGIENARFVCGDLDGEVSGLDALLKTSDLVILDPPRKGIDETLCEKLIASGIRHIVYVSCDCKTLARDCALLTQGGYTLSSVKPVNLFPRTKHCECVLTLTR